MKLIGKEKVIAEIEKLEAQNNCGTSDFIEAKRIAFNQVKRAIDTLEVKEVDLEIEIDRWWWGRTWQTYGMILNPVNIRDFAKHFFELGIKSKGK